jgi:hypothetical protein
MDGTYLTCEFGVWTGGTPQCTECKLFDWNQTESVTQEILKILFLLS